MDNFSGKTDILITWSIMEKKDFQRGLNELHEKDQTIVNTMVDMCQEPWDINKIMGYHPTFDIPIFFLFIYLFAFLSY